MKESYYHHVFHTVALEGNKLTLEEMRYIIDHRAGIQGKSLNEHNEVLGLSEALQFVNNTLLMKNEVTVQDIKDLHKRVMGRNDPVIAGEFRSSQVVVNRSMGVIILTFIAIFNFTLLKALENITVQKNSKKNQK